MFGNKRCCCGRGLHPTLRYGEYGEYIKRALGRWHALYKVEAAPPRKVTHASTLARWRTARTARASKDMLGRVHATQRWRARTCWAQENIERTMNPWVGREVGCADTYASSNGMRAWSCKWHLAQGKYPLHACTSMHTRTCARMPIHIYTPTHTPTRPHADTCPHTHTCKLTNTRPDTNAHTPAPSHARE